MKQILQSLGTGETELVEVPAPRPSAGGMLVQTRCSLVSFGTERMLVNFGKSNLLQKARQQPEKVKQVLEKIQTDGLFATGDAVHSKLSQPIPLGYCNTGVVKETRGEVAGFQIGDRVVSNGPHAELVKVPRNLCARIPEAVDDESAAFTVVASIGLQGIRLAQPTLGESVVVMGAGLIGLLTIQMLAAHGCRVLATDFDGRKLALARKFGAETCDLSNGEDPIEVGMAFSHSRGADAVLITASTDSSDPVSQAARMCRKRGRIVLIGVTGLELNRADFYEKELSFQVSCSYGPGRYDPSYEEGGHDYPLGFVRWTEQRNFESVLDLMARGKIDVKPLITHRFPFNDAVKAYELLGAGTDALGVLFEYERVEGGASGTSRTIAITPRQPAKVEQVVASVIGAGNFTGQVLLPALAKTGIRLRTIVSSGGVSGTHQARKHGFERSSTDVESVFADAETNLVLVTTRHDSHARYVVRALQSGKAAYVEKPLALSAGELKEIHEAYEQASQPFLMVGFNRRFAPLAVKMQTLLQTVHEPKSLVLTINAGVIPPDSWVHDPAAGGGRLIGEGCHFIDLARFLIGAPITQVEAMSIGVHHPRAITDDKVLLHLKFEDGSIAAIQYLGNGSKRFPKERVEAFAGGKVLQLDNFRILRGYGWKGFRKELTFGQDKGHRAEMAAIVRALANGEPAPIPFEELMEVSRVTIQAAKLAAENAPRVNL